MSKLVALAAAGVGATGISVGGYYLFRNGGGSSSGTEQSASNKPTTPVTSIAEDALKTFKENKEGECVTSIFSDQSNINFNDSTINDSLPNSWDDFFDASPTDDNKAEAKSYLLIKWNRKKGNSDPKPWSGSFTWIWTFVNKDKGFINFNEATTTTDKKLSIKGGFYLLEKEGENWKIKDKKEVTSGKELDKDRVKSNFPKSNLSDDKSSNKEYWGFIDKEDDIDNICGAEGTCPDGSPDNSEPKKFKWTFSSSGTKKLGEWNKDLNWWKNIYGGNDNKFDITTKLDSFTGTWTEIKGS